MIRLSRPKILASLTLVLSLHLISVQDSMRAFAQSPESAQPKLADQQSSLANRYAELEKLLLRSAELEAISNPTRSALLKQAVQLSKQVRLSDELVSAAKNIGAQQYSEALERQTTAKANLAKILELLQSENRQDRIREKREEVRRWIEETERLLRMQGALRGRTEGGQDLNLSSENQQQLEKKAAELVEQLGGEPLKDEESAQQGEQQQGEQQQGEQQQGEQQQGEQQQGKQQQGKQQQGKQQQGKQQQGEKKQGKQQQGKQQQGEQQQGEQQQGEQQQGQQQQGQQQQGKQQQGQQQQGQQQQGQQQQGQQQQGQQQQGQQQQGQQQQGQQQQGQQQQGQQQQSPAERAQEKIKSAQEKMRRAQKKLDEAKKEDAVEQQRAAEQELRDAVAELEKILRQLREEEIERSLESLESRLRNMLDLQNTVLNETTRLNDIAAGEPANRQVTILASKLATDEKLIQQAGEKAYLLLREEGSSAAFPEAMQQVNTDISTTVERLSAGDVGKLTILIQQDVIAALEEMVEALVQVQKDNKEEKKQQQQGGGGQMAGGQQGEKPLVNKLAELRLVKTLQTRINRRTQAMADLLEDPESVTGQVDQQDVLMQVRELAEREQKIQKVTIKLIQE